MNTKKWLAYALYIIGFLVPFIASGMVGMPMWSQPWVPIVNFGCWIAAFIIGYFPFSETRKFPPGTTTPLKVVQYIGLSSANIVLMALLIGYLYYPTVSNSIFPRNLSTLLIITLAVMGVQITVKDWKGIITHPKIVLISSATRWIIMPFVAFCVGKFIFGTISGLPEQTSTLLALGMVVLGTTPTGAASNSLTLISRGDLALSVSVTTLNTILAPLLQPLMIGWLAGANIDFTPALRMNMILELLKLVLAPVIISTIFGMIFPAFVQRIKPYLMPIAVFTLALIIMSTMSKGTAVLLKQINILPWILVACCIQGFAGLGLGFYAPKFFGFDFKQRIAACFEVGVENAALTSVVALQFFGPMVALPAILYGKVQNIIAVSIFVPYFIKKDEEMKEKAQEVQAPAE
ncbi:bile acid:sodium symporter [Selenomonadales bacterium OttesenSCG-928-I06]|nr:bile acid:sodium symporter [Selenomonadales bacterium OttesenSCG-928-I06]